MICVRYQIPKSTLVGFLKDFHCILTLVFLFTSCIANDFTCSNILQMDLDVMSPCEFEDTNEDFGFPPVICLMQNKIRDSRFISYFFLLHLRMKFTFIQEYGNFSVLTNYSNVPLTNSTEDSEDNIVSVCVGFSSVFITKVNSRKPWENATLGILPAYGLFFLTSLDDGLLDAEFNSSIPVGIVDLKKDCWEKERTASKCIKRLRIVEKVKNPSAGAIAVEPNFWDRVKNMYDNILGIRIKRLHMDLSPKGGLITDGLIKEGLKGHYVEELQLRGRRMFDGPLLPDLPMLKILDLTNNAISFISTDKFQLFQNVENLTLAKNKLSELPSGVTTLSKLKYLDLSSNPIIDLEKLGVSVESLLHLQNLQWLNLAQIHLRNISLLRPLLGFDQDGFRGVHLHVLNLSRTEISVVDDENIFKYQTSLKNVDLSGNILEHIPSNLFLYNENLTHLNLSHNIFSIGPRLALMDHVILEAIDLSYNRIHYPGNILVSGYVNSLDLSGNNISQWENVTIFSYPSLGLLETNATLETFSEKRPWVRFLNLSNNLIRTVPTIMGQSMEALKNVDLGGNPLDCKNCHTPEFQQWLNSSNVEILNSGTTNKLTCSWPQSERNTRVAEVVFDSSLCEIQDSSNVLLTEGLLVGFFLCLSFAIGISLYKFRFEARYFLHLLSVRRRGKKIAVEGQYQYDAFVCFSGKDRPWVIGKMLPELENGPENFQLCLHERDFVLGSYISHNIVNSMHCSKYTIMVLTNSFIKSQWCRWELDIANHKLFENNRNFLILLEYESLDRSELPHHLRLLMNTRTYLEWPKEGADDKNAWKRLKETLGPSISSELEMQEIPGR